MGLGKERAKRCGMLEIQSSASTTQALTQAQLLANGFQDLFQKPLSLGVAQHYLSVGQTPFPFPLW